MALIITMPNKEPKHQEESLFLGMNIFLGILVFILGSWWGVFELARWVANLLS